MANPVDDFVTTFLGLDESRSLHVDGDLVVDPSVHLGLGLVAVDRGLHLRGEILYAHG